MHKPVFILLTDSGDAAKDATLGTLQAMMQLEYALPEHQQLSLHTLCLGRRSFREAACGYRKWDLSDVPENL